MTDWVDAVIGKYEAYYSVPLLNLDWPTLAAYTADAQRALRRSSAPASTRCTTGRPARSRSPRRRPAPRQISGVQGTGASTYGTDVTSPVTLAANTAVTLTAVPRPDRRHPAKAGSVRIALVSEGTYPYAMGGVSVWCEQLIRGMPDYRWEVVALTVDGTERAVFAAPDNLDRVHLDPAVGCRPPAAAPGGRAPRPARRSPSRTRCSCGRWSPRWRPPGRTRARSAAACSCSRCAACSSTRPTAAT